MRSVKAAAIAALLLTVGAVLAALITKNTVDAFHASGQLGLSERILLAASNWYVRLLPLLALAVVGVAALVAGVGAASEGPSTLRQERYGWAAFAVVSVATGFCSLAVTQFGGSPWWGLGLSVTSASFVVACCGIIVTSVRIYRYQGHELT